MQELAYRELDPQQRRARLKELLAVFFRLGTVAFGGPAAHTAMMEEEVVTRRKWLSREQFLDLMAVSNLIPGPNSTELAILLGQARGGVPGLFVAGAAFILPAFLIVLLFAFLYVRLGQLPQVEGLLYGMMPVILAVVTAALYRLSKSVIKGWWTAALVASCVALRFLGTSEIPLLLGSGLVVALVKNRARLGLKFAFLPLMPLIKQRGLPASLAPLRSSNAISLARLSRAAQDTLSAHKTTLSAAPSLSMMSLPQIFLTFLKIGSVLYGSGYVLLAFLESELVVGLQVLSNRQLLDAVAVGQFTPGPVFTTATFIGYLLSGFWGASAATLGIFLPSFLLVLLLRPLIPRMKASPWFSALLVGVSAASLSLMAVVTFRLGLTALVDYLTIPLYLAALFLLLRYKTNSFWLILAGGLIGFLTRI